MERRPTVRIVVGSRRTDEHLGILSALTDVLDDAKTSRRLAETNDPQEIIAGLSRRTEAEISPAEKLADAKDVEVVIAGSAGLHARPATFFVDVANQFEAEIFVRANGKLANGKAMASLLNLGAAAGSKLQILANGPDADAALAALKAAVERGLGDEEEEEAVVDEVVWTPVSSAHWIGGVSASPGIAIGRLHHFQSNRLVVDDKPEDVETEKQKLKYALEVGREQSSKSTTQ
jgi:phosphocarrier protein FPr